MIVEHTIKNSLRKIATPVNTQYLNLPLPSWERIEVRGNIPRTFFTLTPALSPQGRGRSREAGCERLGSQ